MLLMSINNFCFCFLLKVFQVLLKFNETEGKYILKLLAKLALR